MTSEEIKNTPKYAPLPSTSNGFWLKEIAYQIAVMNERAEKKPVGFAEENGRLQP